MTDSLDSEALVDLLATMLYDGVAAELPMSSNDLARRCGIEPLDPLYLVAQSTWVWAPEFSTGELVGLLEDVLEPARTAALAAGEKPTAAEVDLATRQYCEREMGSGHFTLTCY